MTSPAAKLAKFIDDWAVARGTKVLNWVASCIGGGFENFMHIMSASYQPKVEPLLSSLKNNAAAPEGLKQFFGADFAKFPPELQKLLDEMLKPTGEAGGPLLNMVANQAVGSALGRLMDSLLNIPSYGFAAAFPWTLPPPAQLVQMYYKSKADGMEPKLSDDSLMWLMLCHGFNPLTKDYWKMLYQVALPSELVGPAALRDPAKYEKYWKDVEAGGVTPDRVELMKELQFKMPTVQDVVSWLAHEVFEPDMIAKYGLDDEWDKLDKSLFPKIGLREPMALNYWRNHWQHPAWGQITEMLHRGHLTEKDVSDWYRLVEIPPHWRDMLTKISYNPYTRVDTRRMWDYGVLDDSALLKTYKDLGYDDEHAKNMTTWTKVYTRTPQLIAQYQKGWLSQADVLSQLKSYGLSDERATWVYKTKFQNEAAARTTAQKDLTLAQIIKGVKKGKISRAEGADLIVDMGYDLQEASFILDIEIPEDETDVAVKMRELTKADILSGLRQGTITPEQALPKLIAIRYTPTDAAYIIAVYQASITPPATPTAKSLTKADIVSAVKQGLITPEQGYELLVSVGYSDADANFILAMVPTTSPFSPLNYDEFKAVTQKWRATQGLEVEENIPEVRDMRVALAKAVVEGRTPDMEQTRINIDTIRRKRRKGLISRDEEVKQLTSLGVPADYVKAVVENDDARLTATKP